MKAQIVALTALAPGQLWLNKNTKVVYLTVKLGGSMILVNTEDYQSSWASTFGFGGDDSSFEFVGNLEILK